MVGFSTPKQEYTLLERDLLLVLSLESTNWHLARQQNALIVCDVPRQRMLITVSRLKHITSQLSNTGKHMAKRAQKHSTCLPLLFTVSGGLSKIFSFTKKWTLTPTHYLNLQHTIFFLLLLLFISAELCSPESVSQLH